MGWTFPRDDSTPTLQCTERGTPHNFNIGGFPAGDPSWMDKIAQMWSGKRKRFFARIHSHVGGVWYKILEHQQDAAFSGPLLHAYWLREQADDPALDVGAIVIGGKDRLGRYCFQRVPEIYVGVDAVNKLDQLNDATPYTSAASVSAINDGAVGEEERVIAHFKQPVTVLVDNDEGWRNLALRAYQWCEFTVNWGAGPVFAYDLWVDCSVEMRLILADFTPSTITWDWAYTQGNLTLDTEEFTRTMTTYFTANSDWDPGTDQNTMHRNREHLGNYGMEQEATWTPGATTAYGIELRYVAPVVTKPTGGAVTVVTYDHRMYLSALTSIAWRKLWWA